MRHCSNAVPILNVVNGHMGQEPHKGGRQKQIKLHEKPSNRTYKSKTVVTRRAFNGGKYQLETGCI